MRKLLYLISPQKINRNFYYNLNEVLSVGNVKFFQLRLKKYKFKEIVKIAKKIKKITVKHKVKLIINDDFEVAIKSKADGCHMGQLDGSIALAKKKLRNKILGITCHNSKILAKKAIKDKVSYIAFGSFYKSKLKPKAIKADQTILKWAKIYIKKPIVVIGGIDNSNYKKLIQLGANYIAISSFIWDNPKLKPIDAIRMFK